MRSMAVTEVTTTEDEAIACFAHGLAHLIVTLGPEEALWLAGMAILDMVESRRDEAFANMADSPACSYTA